MVISPLKDGCQVIPFPICAKVWKWYKWPVPRVESMECCSGLNSCFPPMEAYLGPQMPMKNEGSTPQNMGYNP